MPIPPSLSRLRDVVGDWWGDALLFLRFHLPTRARLPRERAPRERSERPVATSAAASALTALCLVGMLASVAFLAYGAVSGSVIMSVTSLVALCGFSLALFTQSDEETTLFETSTVENIIRVDALGFGDDAILTVHTSSLGGEPREYAILRSDLTMVKSPTLWADVRRIGYRRVSRNVFGWVMAREDDEHVQIVAHVPKLSKEDTPR